tara:strand:+ start:592 stop:1368 length:777 start_codon:yes stop_codon:yes gene_type:complete
MYVIIVENDESEWEDQTGEIYHYPNQYQKLLLEGTHFIYYKGKMKNKAFRNARLSEDPYYFGCGVIGACTPDEQSERKNWYCSLLEYEEFSTPVHIKKNGQYIEIIPESKKSNYWRSAVRRVEKEVYEDILSQAKMSTPVRSLPKLSGEFESYEPIEGAKKIRFTTYYERNPFYRKRALEIHGFSCMVCSFNFEKEYGELGKGFIHVHHNKPVSQNEVGIINPETDLSVLCPNCHAMIHRQKSKTLSVDELIAIRKEG